MSPQQLNISSFLTNHDVKMDILKFSLTTAVPAIVGSVCAAAVAIECVRCRFKAAIVCCTTPIMGLETYVATGILPGKVVTFDGL